jgi:PAS domain S-box-containing protein
MYILLVTDSFERRIGLQDKDKTKKQLIDELEEIRNRLADLRALHTERIPVEKIPCDSEEIYEHFYKSNPHPMWIYDLETLAFLDVNDAAVQHYGYSREEFLSMSIKDIRPQKDIPLLLENISKVTKGLDIAGTWTHLKKDGTLIHVEIVSHTLTFAGRRAEIVLAIDITDRGKAEEALHESETKFRRLTEAAFGGIAVTEKGKFVDVSDQFAVLFGYRRSELIGTYAADLIVPKARSEAMEKMKSGYDRPYESLCLRKDGSTFPVEVCGKNYYSQARELRVTAIRDITERKLSEETLRESEEKYKTVTESSLTGIFIHQDDRFIFVNDRFAEMHGYKTEELLGKDHLALIHPDERGTLRDIAAKRLKGKIGPQRYEVRRLRKNGETIWCEMMATRIFYRGRPAIMGNIIDITERKKAEHALMEKERQLEIKANALEESNIALKVLLKRREEDKTELEEKILLNVKELVIPYIEKLKKSGIGEQQRTHVRILESNLNDITSSFSHRLSSKFLNFTPTEIQIANLLRQGKTNKEIGELLNSSERTVAFHRENIRKKLGLKNKRTNLKAYLLSFS